MADRSTDVAEAPAFTGDFKTSGLYAIALENSSTKNLRTRLMEKRRRSQNSVDSDDEPVGHDTPGFLRRVGPTCASSDTTVAFANLNVSSTVSPASNSPAPMHPVQATFHPGYGWELSPSVSFCSASSRASSPSAQVDLALFPICHQAPRRGCMRGPKTRPEEEALLASPRPERSPPVSSDSVVFVEGSRIRTTRMLSLSYSNGDDEVEELTREHENRRRRRSTVICQWGEGVDEIIPGKLNPPLDWRYGFR